MGDLARRRPATATRFALIAKTHHALVDGVSGVDITTVLFDTAPDPAPVPPARARLGRRAPPPHASAAARRRAARARDDARARSRAACARSPARPRARCAGAARRRRRRRWPPRCGRRCARRRPRRSTSRSARTGATRGSTPTSAEFKAIKNELGGTVNDVVLTVVTLALGRYLRRHGHPAEDLVLRALVPVSVRADVERGALGNRVAAMYAPLPVGVEDPEEAYRRVHEAMAGLKESGQAVGAQVITAARRLRAADDPAARRRGCRRASAGSTSSSPTSPARRSRSTSLGRRLLRLYPVVPLVASTRRSASRS